VVDIVAPDADDLGGSRRRQQPSTGRHVVEGALNDRGRVGSGGRTRRVERVPDTLGHDKRIPDEGRDSATRRVLNYRAGFRMAARHFDRLQPSRLAAKLLFCCTLLVIIGILLVPMGNIVIEPNADGSNLGILRASEVRKYWLALATKIAALLGFVVLLSPGMSRLDRAWAIATLAISCLTWLSLRGGA
jgi:hypothetical protein